LRGVIVSFNGKPQESLPEFASACGSPLNKNAQSITRSTVRLVTDPGEMLKEMPTMISLFSVGSVVQSLLKR